MDVGGDSEGPQQFCSTRQELIAQRKRCLGRKVLRNRAVGSRRKSKEVTSGPESKGALRASAKMEHGSWDQR